jgi:hypothetical protein
MTGTRFTGHPIIIGHEEVTEEDLRVIQKAHTQGGEGSGNFDHAGRPGEVGGSAPRDYAPNELIMEGSTMVEKDATDEKVISRWRNLPNNQVVKSDEDLKTTKEYCGTATSFLLNSYLRDEKFSDYAKEQEKTDILNLDKQMGKALDNAPIVPKGTILYRGVSERSARETFADAHIGDEVIDRGYQSTSVNATWAFGFSEGIRSTKNTLVRYIMDGKTKGLGGKSETELEVVLPKRMTSRIVDIQDYYPVPTEDKPTFYGLPCRVITMVPTGVKYD